jgi:hypothetical protein
MSMSWVHPLRIGDAVLYLVIVYYSPTQLLLLRVTHMHAHLLQLQLLHPSAASTRIKIIQAYATYDALPAVRVMLDSPADRYTVSFNILLRALVRRDDPRWTAGALTMHSEHSRSMRENTEKEEDVVLLKLTQLLDSIFIA